MDCGWPGKTFCEFFAGIGLIHEALRHGGWRCIYANDHDPRKREMYLSRFPAADYYHQQDVWATEEVVSRIETPPFLATASFPCTDMSLAGRRQGFRGGQSSAFFGFTAAIDRLGEGRPAIILLENVAGFLGANGGRDFAAAAEELAGLGYWLDALLLDAKDFLPQSRPRLFVVGRHQSLNSPLLIRSGVSPENFLCDAWRQEIERSPRLRPPRLQQQMRQLNLATGWATVRLEPPLPRRYRLADYLDLDDDQPWWDAVRVDKHYAMMSDPHRQLVDRWLASGQREVATVYRRIREGRQRAEVRADGVAGCLRTPRGGSARQIILWADGGRLRMRWMTPAEYARLQGVESWPNDHPTGRSLFGFGDAVCVPVIRWIDQHLLTPLYETHSWNAPQHRG